MEFGDRDVIASAPMTVAWRAATEDLGIRFESPFAMVYREREVWCSGLLPDFGNSRGSIIAGRFTVDDIFDVAQALGYYASALAPHSYETYDRAIFVETLNDWGWFGDPEDAPLWFGGGYARHGGAR